MHIISRELSQKILMTGVKYKDHHPGGISSVVQYWSEYIDSIRYFPMFKEGSKLCKITIFICSYIRLLLTLLLDCRVRIVHVHTAAGTDFERSSKIVTLAKLFRKKVIIHSHASQFKVYYSEASASHKRKIVHTLRQANILIALSESWRKWFESIGVNPDKIIILHNITAFPTTLTNDGNAYMKDINERPVRFLFLGEIGQRKGVFNILQALTKHRKELEGKMELRIGGNKHEDELKKAIANGKLNNMVKYEGWVSGEKKTELLNWADVFILPSFNEGLPISILEAMSYKMPIVSTPVGGIPEVIDKRNGILVTPGNDEEIFAAINQYVNDKTEIATQGEESFRRVKSYLPDHVLNHLKKIYELLLKQ